MSMSTASRHSSENQRLLEAARAGDRSAFGHLAEGYRPYLKKVASQVLGDRLPSDGSDVVQTGLQLAFERIAQFQNREPAAFLGWLAAIVANVARQSLRREHRFQPLPIGLEEDKLAGKSLRPDEEAKKRIWAAWLVEAIERLPEDHRKVIELRNFKELPFEQVAQSMGRSCAAVRKLWTRAIDGLRQELGDNS